uniref:hypothetical protein n=1 Tax=Neisseria sicca TaxID=490 RepID=UPI001649BD91
MEDEEIGLREKKEEHRGLVFLDSKERGALRGLGVEKGGEFEGIDFGCVEEEGGEVGFVIN